MSSPTVARLNLKVHLVMSMLVAREYNSMSVQVKHLRKSYDCKILKYYNGHVIKHLYCTTLLMIFNLTRELCASKIFVLHYTVNKIQHMLCARKTPAYLETTSLVCSWANFSKAPINALTDASK